MKYCSNPSIARMLTSYEFQISEIALSEKIIHDLCQCESFGVACAKLYHAVNRGNVSHLSSAALPRYLSTNVSNAFAFTEIDLLTWRTYS